MSLYLDTSLLVSAFTNEAQTAVARAWLQSAQAERKLISWWVETEFAAAMAAKMGGWPERIVAGEVIMKEFTAFAFESLEVLPVDHTHFQRAGELSLKLGGLRAGDALHLAIAATHGAAVCTRDRGMAKACIELGISTQLI